MKERKVDKTKKVCFRNEKLCYVTWANPHIGTYSWELLCASLDQRTYLSPMNSSSFIITTCVCDHWISVIDLISIKLPSRLPLHPLLSPGQAICTNQGPQLSTVTDMDQFTLNLEWLAFFYCASILVFWLTECGVSSIIRISGYWENLKSLSPFIFSFVLFSFFLPSLCLSSFISSFLNQNASQETTMLHPVWVCKNFLLLSATPELRRTCPSWLSWLFFLSGTLSRGLAAEMFSFQN